MNTTPVYLNVPQFIEKHPTFTIGGNRVPKSLGAKPAMILPDAFPEDID